jgi:RNA polymerase sigma-70 factor (ECF subfamily)
MAEMADSKQEAWWVLRAQTGDRAALDELLQSVQTTLYRYIVRLVGEPATAEDVLQEVFLQIYRKLRWLREPELFRPWAYRIASRAAFKRLKRERRWTEQIRDETLLSSLPAQATDECASVLREQLAQYVARVPPASRAVLVLHYFHDMPLTEIAVVLDLALGTVKSRLAYGLATLRRAIGEQQP